MKKIMTFLAISITFAANAQKIKDSEVPANLIEAFKKNHPDTKEMKWEKEGGNYEVEFKSGNVEQSLLYHESGTVLEIEVAIAVSELPAGVQEYVSKNYAGQKIKEAAKITNAEGNIVYEAGIKGKDLIFDRNGLFLREEKDGE